jgi:hypothetical protein
VATGLGANNGVLAKLLLPVIGLFMRSPEKGAATQIYLAASPEVEGISGKYFIDCKPGQSSPESYDTGVAQRLWEVSAMMTGVGAQPGDMPDA